MNKQKLVNRPIDRNDYAPIHSLPAGASGEKRQRKIATLLIAMVLVLAAGFAAAIFSAYSAEKLKEAERITVFSVRGTALDLSETQRVLDLSAETEEIPSFVLWEQRGFENVQNPKLGRSAEVNVLLAEGNIALLFQGAYLPQGDWIDIGMNTVCDNNQELCMSSMATRGEMQQACIIDSTTALALFGDVAVEGFSVTYGEEVFIIERVVDTVRPFLLIHPTQQSGVALSMLTFHNSTVESPVSPSRNYPLWLGLDAEVFEYELLYHLAYLLCWLPTLFLGLLCLLYLLKQGFAKSNTARQQAIFLLSFLTGSIVFIIFIASNVEIPRDFIPSRFSDFSLWQQIFEDKWTTLVGLFEAPLYVPVAPLVDNFLLVVVFTVLSFLLYLEAFWLFVQTRFSTYRQQNIKRQNLLDAGEHTRKRHLGLHHTHMGLLASEDRNSSLGSKHQ